MPTAPDIDLSFVRYVQARKGDAAARLREGAAYAYSGDLKVRQTLDRVRPVTLAVEATVRFWQSVGKGQLLGSAIKVGEKQFPKIHALLKSCADALQIPVPALYISPEVALGAHTFGTTDEATIVVNGTLVDHLTAAELVSVLGHECGHIQNNHVVYMTTLYFLTNAANLFVRWGTKPAVLALNAWSRRAELTCDRASLLCSKSLEVSTAALVKLAIGSRKLYSDVNVDEYLRQLDAAAGSAGRFGELLSTHPYLPKRVQALRLFAGTALFKSVVGDKSPGGISKVECDALVGELVSVL